MAPYKSDAEARYAAQALRRKLEEVVKMLRQNPQLVRVAAGDGGDRVAFWYGQSGETRYNLSAAERQLAAILKQYPDALTSRSGKIVELPIVGG